MASFIQWRKQDSSTNSLSCQSQKARNKLCWMMLTYALGYLVSKPLVTKALEVFLCVALCCSPRQGTGCALWQDWWSTKGRGGRAPAVCGGGRQNSDHGGQINHQVKCRKSFSCGRLHVISGSRSAGICAPKLSHCNIPWTCVCVVLNRQFEVAG